MCFARRTVLTYLVPPNPGEDQPHSIQITQDPNLCPSLARPTHAQTDNLSRELRQVKDSLHYSAPHPDEAYEKFLLWSTEENVPPLASQPNLLGISAQPNLREGPIQIQPDLPDVTIQLSPPAPTSSDVCDPRVIELAGMIKRAVFRVAYCITGCTL